MSTIDFADLKERVSIVDTLERLGITMQVRGGQLRSKCPICQGDDPRKFVVTPAKNLWYSFCCKIGGDQISLVAKVKDIPLRDAAAFLSGDTEPAQDKRATAPQEQRERDQPLRPLDYLEPDHEAVLAVGINPLVAKRLGIGYAGKGVARGHVLIPVRDEAGVLHGYIGIEEATFLPRDFQLPDNVVQLKKPA